MRIHFNKFYFLCCIWNLLLQKCENCPDFLHFCWIIEEEPYAFSMFWKYFLPNLDFGYIFCHLGWQDSPLFAPLATTLNNNNIIIVTISQPCLGQFFYLQSQNLAWWYFWLDLNTFIWITYSHCLICFWRLFWDLPGGLRI